jgi:hypothetical protein
MPGTNKQNPMEGMQQMMQSPRRAKRVNSMGPDYSVSPMYNMVQKGMQDRARNPMLSGPMQNMMPGQMGGGLQAQEDKMMRNMPPVRNVPQDFSYGKDM